MKNRHYAIIGLFIALVIWQISSFLNMLNPLFLPSPIGVFLALISDIAVAGFWIDVFSTLYKALLALIIATCIAVPLGLLLGYYRRVYSTFEFVLEFFRSIPCTAFFPLFLLLLGIGDLSKIAILVWTASFTIMIYAIYGVKYIRKTRLEVARSLKIRGISLFTKFIFPEALPQILIGGRIALSNALIVVVVVEMFIGSNIGLGKRIIDNQLVYNIPEMYAAILMTGILGYTLNMLLVKCEKRIVHWKIKD
jgi:ABC-type nitrate/sulfonate/bicarbonate transport system permease component